MKLGPPVRIASYRVFSVCESTVEGRSSVFTLEHPDWCNVVALTDAGEIVLVRQLRFGTRAMSLELPGGMLEPGEDPAAGARRELREETGYEPASIDPLIVTHPNPSLQGNRIHSFVARGARVLHATQFDEHEECETVLVPAERIERMLDEGEMTHALDHAALSAFLRRERR